MAKKHRNFSVLNARFTSSVSVALVLLMLGIVAVAAIGARSMTREIKENLGFTIVLQENETEESAQALADAVASEPFARQVSLLTPEEAMVRWEEQIGENIVEVIGVNPFSTEINVRVTEEYAVPDSLNMLSGRYAALDIVDEVTMRAELIDDINRNLRTAVIILGSVALALLIISLVLINNTVRLTVYARRFSIHTMKLVGATDGFIRRPFVISSMISGAVSGAVASAALAGMLAYAGSVNGAVTKMVTWNDMILLCAGLIVTGTLICAAAAAFSTARYLRMSYDDMFE